MVQEDPRPGLQLPQRVRPLDARDDGGQKTDEPRLLDGNGGLLPTGGTPEYIEYDVYEELDFSVFNFDFSDSTGGDDWPIGGE